MKKKITLSLDEDALSMLSRLASERRRGRLVSDLIRQHFRRTVERDPQAISDELWEIAVAVQEMADS